MERAGTPCEGWQPSQDCQTSCQQRVMPRLSVRTKPSTGPQLNYPRKLTLRLPPPVCRASDNEQEHQERKEDRSDYARDYPRLDASTVLLARRSGTDPPELLHPHYERRNPGERPEHKTQQTENEDETASS